MKIIIFSDVPAAGVADQIEADFCVRPECVNIDWGNIAVLRKYQPRMDDKNTLLILLTTSGYSQIMDFILAVRSFSSVPVLLVANELSTADEYIVRNAGVDDIKDGLEYDGVFCLKIRSVKRWLDRLESTDNKSHISFGHWVFQKNVSTVIAPDKRTFKLSRNEYRFLELLLERQGDIITRSEISRYVFRREWDPTDKSIDMLVSRLRCRFRKIERCEPPVIENVRGVGYTLTLN